MFEFYKPDDMMAMAEGISKLMPLKMGPATSPADLFSSLVDIQNKHKSATNQIDQSTIISSVLRAVPDSYKGVITTLQLQMGSALTVDDVEKAMMLMYRNKQNTNKPKPNEGEVVLLSFTGACYKCRKVGHVKADCPMNKVAATRGGRTNKHKEPWHKCTTCGKEHAGPCWEDEKNAHLPPTSWTSSKQFDGHISAVAMNGADQGELLLSGISTMDWCSLDMPEGVSKDIEEEEMENDDDEPNWFPFKRFLNLDDQPDTLPVLDAISVMKDHNKNREMQIKESVIEKYANGFLLDQELGLKATDKPSKLSFPNVRAMLTDPCIFIADSGVTTHATASKMGMTNLRNGEDGEYIEIASGLHEAAMQIGDLSCVICNQHGQELQNVTLSDITYSPSLKFNLFSTTKLQCDGWKMIGDVNTITMQKGSMTLCFDIVVPTSKDAIYCVYLKRGCKMANVVTQGMGEPVVTTMMIRQAHERFGHNNLSHSQAPGHQDHTRSYDAMQGMHQGQGQAEERSQDQ
jgi:Zinc knuckle